MALGLLGKKIGMSQIFDEKGAVVPVTLILAGPCPVLMKRETGRDGYEAIQVGFDEIAERKATKPELGNFKKAGSAPQRFVREFRGEDTSGLQVGQTLRVDLFEMDDLVDIIATSKGRGFAGPYKRHKMRPGPKTHGSMYHNRAGSNAGSSEPAHTFKGRRGAGQMGSARVTVKNLAVVRADIDRNLLLVRGSVPGPAGGYVLVRKTNKKLRRPQVVVQTKINPMKASKKKG